MSQPPVFTVETGGYLFKGQVMSEFITRHFESRIARMNE